MTAGKQFAEGSIPTGYLYKLPEHPDDSDLIDSAASDVNIPIRRRHHMADNTTA
jgi:hypothetical protein